MFAGVFLYPKFIIWCLFGVCSVKICSILFVSSFRLFAPTIEEYANQVEADKTIDAGNSFRGILYEIGKLPEIFKEMIREGLCWFPRLMR